MHYRMLGAGKYLRVIPVARPFTTKGALFLVGGGFGRLFFSQCGWRWWRWQQLG